MKRLHLITNSKSGKGGGTTVRQIAEKLCLQYAWELTVYEVTPETIEQKIDQAVDSVKKDLGILVAAGGDGTIRSAAQKIFGQDIRFGIVPCGTFNYFARTHQIPEDPEQALEIILTGKTKKVRLGVVNGEVFLINASLGLYAKSIRDREERTSVWGRNRVVAIISTMVTLFQGYRSMRVDLIKDGHEMSVKTLLIFIGNNALQLRNLALDIAQCMKKDLLALVTLKPLNTWGMIKLLFRGLFRTLEHEENLDMFCVDRLKIYTRKKSQTVALDGELFKMPSTLEVKSLPEALNLMVPP